MPEGLRSQSVHGKVTGRDRSKVAANGGGVKLPAVDRRPASMHSAAPQTKGGGGGRGGGAVSKRLKGDDIAAAAVAKASGEAGRAARVPPSPRGSVSGEEPPVNGFMKLAAMGKKKAGPMVVTYEDEPEGDFVRGSPAPITKHRGGGGVRESNKELKGASEMFMVGGANEVGIADDQLEKLLNKARGARN